MALSNDLISQFVKATRDKQKVTKESTAYGKIVIQGDNRYVQLDGSDLLTPISSTTVVEDGDRVLVTVKDHSAIVTGDLTNPSASNSQVQEIGSKISEFEIIIADKVTTQDLEAVNAYIQNITAITGKYTELSAINAQIETLQAKYANLDHVTAIDITAINAEIESLKADFGEFTNISTEDLEAINAELANLEAYNANFTYVSADVLEALKADIKELNVKKLDAESANIKYANIDFSNIGEAAIEKLFTDSGIIRDLIMSDGKVTGHLVGVTITGDLIEGNTIKADKLVIQGEDGLYYKLNVNALGEATASSDEKYQNGLDGSIIVAESITAEKIAVDDLVAFGATIGGYHITDHSLYSGVKNSVSNTTQGVFLGDDGQIAIGDSNNYLRFFVDDNGEYKLEIKASSIEFGASDSNDIKIGGRNLLLDSEEGYEYQYSDYTNCAGWIGRNFATRAAGKGNLYIDVTNMLSIPLHDFSIRMGETISFSLDTHVVGSFTNLRFDILLVYEREILANPIALVPNDCMKDSWFRISATDVIKDNVPYTQGGLQLVAYLKVSWDDSVVGSAGRYRFPKLEFATNPSEWTPAPEDINNKLDEEYYTKEETDAKLVVESDRISSTVTESIVIGGTNLLLDSDVGYPYTDSDYPDVSDSEDKLVTVLTPGKGNNYTSIKDKLSIIPSDFKTKIDESMAFSIDAKVTGSFTNLRYGIRVTSNGASWIDPIIFIPDDCEKDAWFRIAGLDKVTRIKQLYNYQDVYSKSGSVILGEDGWVTLTYDFSEGESTESRWITYATKYIAELTPDTKYNLFLEVKEVSGTGNIMPCSDSSDQFNQLMVTEELGGGTVAPFNKMQNNTVYNFIVTTKSAFSASNKSLSMAFLFYGGQSGSITFRTSLLEDIYLKPDDFVYIPYGEAAEEAIFSVAWDDSTEGSTIEYRLPKLELGNKDTKWTPAPEDIINTLDEDYYTKDEVDNRFIISESTIQQLSNSISMLVRDSNGSSLMTQTSDGWVFSTDAIEKAIQDTLEGLGNLSSEIGSTNGTVDALQKVVENLSSTSEYVKIGAYQDEPCIELGESDSDFKLLITNTRILFLEGSNVPVYISNNSLYGKRFIVEDELQQGGFAWIEHGDGNLGLVWKGSDS